MVRAVSYDINIMVQCRTRRVADELAEPADCHLKGVDPDWARRCCLSMRRVDVIANAACSVGTGFFEKLSKLVDNPVRKVTQLVT